MGSPTAWVESIEFVFIITTNPITKFHAEDTFRRSGGIYSFCHKAYIRDRKNKEPGGSVPAYVRVNKGAHALMYSTQRLMKYKIS